MATEGAAPPRPKGDPHGVQHGWLAEHRGQLVGLRLLDGKAITGTLRGHDTYTLVLDRDDGACLVFKHAVAVCLPASVLRDPAPRP